MEVSAQARKSSCLGFSSVAPTPWRVDVAGRRGCLFPHHPPPGDVMPRQPMAGVSPSSPSPFLFPPSLGPRLSRLTGPDLGALEVSGGLVVRDQPASSHPGQAKKLWE